MFLYLYEEYRITVPVRQLLRHCRVTGQYGGCVQAVLLLNLADFEQISLACVPHHECTEPTEVFALD
jgi:hypothetical protein